ncbi:DNA-formamidopyrimidine glycosylase family protein [Actinoallomurus sp. NPDC052274]|uniref:DNA-formamidopyrimidine glycosylase family protein n=1 Tax=Actinoallomurus sp. NPDC052274 TaxID=3155420 RepID=UPI00343724E0
MRDSPAPVGGPVLILHFGMTGSLSWHSPDEPPHPHDRVIWSLRDGELRFRDMRCSGTKKCYPRCPRI